MEAYTREELTLALVTQEASLLALVNSLKTLIRQDFASQTLGCRALLHLCTDAEAVAGEMLDLHRKLAELPTYTPMEEDDW